METVQREERSGRQDLLSPNASLYFSLSSLQSADWCLDGRDSCPALARLPTAIDAHMTRDWSQLLHAHFNLADSFRGRAPASDQSSGLSSGQILIISGLSVGCAPLGQGWVKRVKVMIYTSPLEVKNSFSFKLRTIFLPDHSAASYNVQSTFDRSKFLKTLIISVILYSHFNIVISPVKCQRNYMSSFFPWQKRQLLLERTKLSTSREQHRFNTVI